MKKREKSLDEDLENFTSKILSHRLSKSANAELPSSIFKTPYPGPAQARKEKCQEDEDKKFEKGNIVLLARPLAVCKSAHVPSIRPVHQ